VRGIKNSVEASAGEENHAGEGANMTEVLTTIGVMVLFLVVFGVGIVWATHGHPSDADNESLSAAGRDH
jgi:hypothetical protein